MFKAVLAVSLFFTVIPAFAANNTNSGVYQSTYSATSMFTRSICAAGDRAYLHRVCVVDGVAASTAAVYNSSFTVADVVPTGRQNLSGVIDGSVQGCFELGVAASNGLFVHQFGTAGYNIIFDCYR